MASLQPPSLIVLLILVAGCTDAAPSGGAGPVVSAGAPSAGPDVGTLHVTVTTDELAPVEGAQVLVTQLESLRITAKDGTVDFESLVPGQYSVVAAKPGFQPRERTGKVVEVIAGETTKATLVLNSVQVANASQAYHITSIYRGHLGCSIATQTGQAASSCRGVGAGSIVVSDPNEKSIHNLVLENAHAWGVVLEAKWTPTAAGLAPQMHLSLNRETRCSPGCTVDGQLLEARGGTPLYAASASDQVVAKYLGASATFPGLTYVALRATCGTGCTGASITFQQSYDAYGTVFYYAPAPPTFRMISAT